MRNDSALTGPSRVLAIISTLLLQFALYDRQGAVASECFHLGGALLISGVIYAIGNYAVRNQKRRGASRVLAGSCYAALVVSPFLWDFVQRWAGQGGQPFEIQCALALRNMMLGLVAKSADRRGHMFAALASCFLALFSILWLMNRWTIALLFIYAIVGMWWLMGLYWDRISGCFLSHAERNVPWKPLTAAAGLAALGLLLLLPLATGRHFTTAVKGFLPSSGGSHWQDEFAYGGVGDGPQMVSAKENASGFGPIESELFLESKMPSLYDCFNELSDEPPKPKQGRQKAIPLAPSLMQQNHQQLAANQQASREFNAVRQRKQETAKVSDLRSAALLQVAGRVPVHLGLQTYDLWDGRTLATSNREAARPLYLDNAAGDGRAWARYADAAVNKLLHYRDHHELRIINLKTDRIPAPPNIQRVHVDKLHTEKLFTCTPDGMLAIDLEFIPQLTVLHVESLQRSSSTDPKLDKTASTPAIADDLVRNLALKWTSGLNGDWEKVTAICERLRTDYVLDPKQMAPTDVEDAAAHFLLQSKRGPDYLFATSAALLIRSLGYDARVVSGFYANPENYDRQSRLTSVYASDAHFWIEVLASAPASDASNGDNQRYWLPLEPSPGYEVLHAPETFWSQLLVRASLTWNALKRNPIPTIAALAICILGWRKRAAACDFFITGWWKINYRWGDVRHQVISTLRLLNRRAYVRGFARNKGTPLSRWGLATQTRERGADTWAITFHDLANWALYGDGISLACPPHEVASLCREAAAFAYRSPSKPAGSDGSPSDRRNA